MFTHPHPESNGSQKDQVTRSLDHPLEEGSNMYDDAVCMQGEEPGSKDVNRILTHQKFKALKTLREPRFLKTAMAGELPLLLPPRKPTPDINLDAPLSSNPSSSPSGTDTQPTLSSKMHSPKAVPVNSTAPPRDDNTGVRTISQEALQLLLLPRELDPTQPDMEIPKTRRGDLFTSDDDRDFHLSRGIEGQSTISRFIEAQRRRTEEIERLTMLVAQKYAEIAILKASQSSAVPGALLNLQEENAHLKSDNAALRKQLEELTQQMICDQRPANEWIDKLLAKL
ncbi:hypothetical protein HAX54_012096 [Datura stramonium]|uniref:Uncharacterized protein n=1 Tax=Datura stramonium TaxID=4076 RepID=A0ABS8Y347_DATST|nr:hypothetical protein [Datura stramonium]